MTKDMTTGKPMPLLLSFMLPLLGGNLFQQFYNMADTIIVGRFLGLNPLASVGSCASILFLVLGFCMGLSAGFSIPIAQKFGARQESMLRRFMVNGWYLAAVISVVMTVVTVLACHAILTFMKTPAVLFQDAYDYQVIIFWGIPFTILYNYASGIIRAIGDAKTPFYFLVLSTILNIFLDLFCIIYLKMGVSGAAVATVIAQAVSGVFCVVYMYRKYQLLRPKRSEMVPDRRKCRVMLGMGLPMGLQFSITAIGSVMLQSAVNMLGTVYVASYATALKLKSIFIGVCDALGNTMAVYCGQNLGAGRKDRIRAGIAASIKISVVLSVISMAILWTLTDKLALLFMDASNKQVIANVCLFMRCTSCFYIVLYLLCIFRNSVQGMGASKTAMFAGLIEMTARTVSSLWLIPPLGYIMVCFTDQLAWGAATVFLVLVFRSIMRRAPSADQLR